MIKKITALIISVVMMLLLASCNVSQVKRTTPSNLVTCINYYPINSYVVDDKPYVSVNNLSNYGFDVKSEENAYTISIGEKEMKPSYDIEYLSEKQLNKKGEKVADTDVQILINDQKIPAILIKNEVYMPFDALGLFAQGVEDTKEVYNYVIRDLKGLAPKNEYKYIKLKAKVYDAEEFLTLTLDDITNVFGADYTREFTDEYAVISYDEKVCPVKFCFDFAEGDSADKMRESKVKKITVSDKKVKLMEKEVIGLGIGDIEKMVDNKINIHDDENQSYAVYNYYKNYKIKFMLDKDEKISSYEIETK